MKIMIFAREHILVKLLQNCTFQKQSSRFVLLKEYSKNLMWFVFLVKQPETLYFSRNIFGIRKL